LKYVADFNVIKQDYEEKLNLYEIRLASEIDRLADFFSSLFGEVIDIPAKPQVPTPPGRYAGEFMLFNATEKVSWLQEHPDAKIALNNMDDLLYGNVGYMTTADGVGADMSFAYSGHVWGLLGQGGAAMPGNATAFMRPGRFGTYADGFTAQNPAAGTAHLMVSIFPDDSTWTGAADTSIVIRASGETWGSFEEKVGFIEQPEVPAMPSGGIDGAYALSAGAVIAAIAINMY